MYRRTFEKICAGTGDDDRISQDEITKVFIPGIREKTGGIPLAVERLGNAIF